MLKSSEKTAALMGHVYPGYCPDQTDNEAYEKTLEFYLDSLDKL